MNRKSRDFKATQVFGWENEPADERPSDFVTTGYSTGYGTGYGALAEPARPRRRRGGLTTLLFTAAVLGSGVFGMLMMVRSLRGG